MGILPFMRLCQKPDRKGGLDSFAERQNSAKWFVTLAIDYLVNCCFHIFFRPEIWRTSASYVFLAISWWRSS